MAVVKMHKASDGSYHESFEDFARREEVLKITPQLEALFEASDLTSSEFEVVQKFVIDNSALLRAILNDAVVTKRGRKAA